MSTPAPKPINPYVATIGIWLADQPEETHSRYEDAGSTAVRRPARCYSVRAPRWASSGWRCRRYCGSRRPAIGLRHLLDEHPRQHAVRVDDRAGAGRRRRQSNGETARRQRGLTTAASIPGPACAPITAPTSVTTTEPTDGSRSRNRAASSSARRALSR